MSIRSVISGSRSVGLSNVTLDDIRRAHAVHPITAVQEQWSLTQRDVESFLPTLADLGIALVAHSPLGHGSLIHSTDKRAAASVADIASRVGATVGQIALAWVHHRGRRAASTVIPLPGTTSITHLYANIAAARIELSDHDLAQLESSGLD
jgi:aryl-alcohol dehydrogenase-like predicted oxidoreductase